MDANNGKTDWAIRSTSTELLNRSWSGHQFSVTGAVSGPLTHNGVRETIAQLRPVFAVLGKTEQRLERKAGSWLFLAVRRDLPMHQHSRCVYR